MLGEKIKKFRKQKGYTQKQLAEKAGISRTALIRYENGDMSPSIQILQQIAAALNIPVSDIFPGTGADNRIADLHREIQKRDRTITELEPDCEHIMNMHQANQYFEKLQIVQDKLDKRALLEGLAEEASELAQAALKLIRAMGSSKNVTPTSEEEAWEHLHEEIADVQNCLNSLQVCDEDFLDIQQEKMIHWADRLTASQETDE